MNTNSGINIVQRWDWLSRGCFGLVLSFGLLVSVARAQEKNSELIRMVLELLQDKDKDMRSVALEQVRTEAKGADATKQFASQLPKLMPVAQVGLLSALASRGDVAAKPDVVSLLKSSSDESVRVAAIGALGELGDATDLPLLLPLLRGDSNDLRIASMKSLTHLRGSAVNSALAAELKNSNSGTRVSLIEVLVTRRAMDSMAQISAAAMDPDSKVRRAAMTALAALGDAKQVPDMIQGVLKSEKGSERDAAEKALVNLCNRISKPDQRAETVLDARAKLDDESQLDLLSTVARIGGAKALEAVEAAMANSNPKQHAAGLQAFCNWSDYGITDKLAKLIENTADKNERSLEFKALVRLASIREKRNDLERLARFKQAMSLAKSTDEQAMVIDKCRSAYSIETLRFVLPYLDQPTFSELTCETIVELAHHREVREPNKEEFDKVLDRVIQLSKDATVKDRAERYKKGETWQRPKGK